MRYNSYARGVDVVLTEEAAEWLEKCHPVKAERAQIIAKFRHVFSLLRQSGLGIGKPHIDRITGYGNLWETRVNHPTGAYRAFFGLAKNGAVIVVAYGEVKKSDRFPARTYKLAEQKVRDAVEQYDRERRP